MNLVGVGGKLYNFAKSALLLAVELLCRRGANSRADGELECPLFAELIVPQEVGGCLFSSGGESKSRLGFFGGAFLHYSKPSNFAILTFLALCVIMFLDKGSREPIALKLKGT